MPLTGVFVTGLTELRAALVSMPQDVATDASDLVELTAYRVAGQLHMVYPPGDAQGGIVVETSGARTLLIEASVISTWWLAIIWEFGTVPRYTRRGFYRGIGPEHPDRGLVKIADRERRQMFIELIAMLRVRGFIVTGNQEVGVRTLRPRPGGGALPSGRAYARRRS